MVSAAYAVAVLLGAASQVQAAQLPRYSFRNGTVAEPKLKGTGVVTSSHGPSATASLHPSKPFPTHTTPVFVNTVPLATLLPNVHWSFDTGLVKNVVPVQPEKGSEMYYGVSDPSKSGHFAFLTYHFTLPSVNIDHTDHVTVRYHAHDGITASFSTQKAFQHALDTWSAKDGLVLIAHVPGCKGHGRGERCYFSVSDLQFNHQELSVVAQGSSKHPDEITTSGETEWGWWDASKANTAASGSGPVAHSPSAFSALASPPKPISSADNTKDASDKPLGLLECVAEPDPETGLPTACLGASFDHILDKKLGYGSLSAKSRQYLDDIMSGTAPGMNSTSSSPRFTPRASSKMRAPAIRSLSSKRSFWSRIGHFFKRAIQTIYDAVTDTVSIGGNFNGEFAFKLPDPASPNEAARTLLGDLVQAESPWGEAILLKTLQSSQGAITDNLNVYCVGCGIIGHARVAGRAKWAPRQGVQEGHVELTTSLQLVMKLGVDGTATLEQDFSTDLLSYGLPALSYGCVSIGPYVTLGAHVGLAAGATGSILAGAEMDWQGARVVMDVTDPSKHDMSGWNRPTIKPVFEAAGEVHVSAELGLPVGLKCGLKISSWETSVGVVDEPSVKGIASGGVSAGLKPVTSMNKTMTGGFDSGCAGIMTEISWRNRFWAGSVQPGDVPWYDSGDAPLLGKCIGKPWAPTRRAEAINAGNNLPGQAVQPSPKSDHPVQQLTYTPSTMPSKLYDESSAATTLTHLLNPHESTKLLSCTNGNIYAVRNDNSTNDFCSSDWEIATQHSVVVRDALRRPILYYGDTMSTLGVSRLRTSDVDMAPKTGVAVALVPLRDEEGTQKRKREQEQKKEMELYVAMDPSGEVFYPVVCDYVDRGSGSKVFLVRDMEDGLEVLKRGDVVRSVTGGEVEKCVLLAIKAGGVEI
ncbi:hypothetical protein E4U60_000095 [Claviceps pazoutovae]|uniref:DUF7029 domain-containing protein n=1 Tax=Claviceps pazoutovae TaxID=1649127 RepID=A0A9P7SK79_9HYPO|nr:hypothetical protein E4U60_000095 [Claviceps pazoutovae]